MADPLKRHQQRPEEHSATSRNIQRPDPSGPEGNLMREALREGGELYSKLIDTMPDIMVRMNLDGEILFVNQAGLRIGNYQTTEMVGKNMLSFIAPEDHEKAARNTALRYQQQIGPQEYHLITKDGRRLLFEVNGDILRNEDGSPYGMFHICRDITARKRMESETAILVEIGRVISSTLDIQKVYERFAAEVRKLIPLDRIHLNLKDPGGETFTIAYVSGTDIAGRRPGDRVPLAGSITDVLFRSRISILLNPASNEEILRRYPSVTEATTFRMGMRSMMAVPLISGDEVIGGLHFRSKQANAYTEQDLSLAERIGAQIAGAIANAQIFGALGKAERALRESEERYRKIFEDAGDYVLVLDLDQNGAPVIVDANEAALQAHGYSRTDLIGKPIALIDAEESADRIEERMRAIAGGGPCTFEARHKRRDGSLFDAEVKATRVRIGGKDFVICIERDITERKRMEIAIRESEQRMSLLFNKAAFGVSLSRMSDGVIVDINEKVEKDLGFTREELIGKTAVDLGINPDPEMRARMIAELQAHGSIHDIEIKLLKRDGRSVIMLFNIDLVEIGGEKYSLWVAQDITRRKQTELENQVLAEIGRVIASSLNIEEVYKSFAEEVQKIIPLDRIYLCLINADRESHTITYLYGEEAPGRKKGDVVPLEGTVTQYVADTRKGFRTPHEGDAGLKDRLHHSSTLAQCGDGKHSIMAVPLIHRDEVVGVLHFGRHKQDGYSERDLAFAEEIGLLIAPAVANSQLYLNLQHSEKEKRESLDKLTSLNANLAEGMVYQIDSGKDGLQRKFSYVSEAVNKMHGFSQEEIIRNPTLIYGQVLEEDRPIVAEREASAFATKTRMGFDVRVRMPSGEIRWRNFVSFPRITEEGHWVWDGIEIDITGRKRAEEALNDTLNQLESRVRERTLELQETNTALQVLLKRGDQEQKKMEESVQSNINQLVLPFLSKLRVSRSDAERQTYLNIVETNLGNILSQFINQLSSAYRTLTPKEIQIAELVKQGKKSKEIAELFGLSVGTVITHRNNIRKKLDLISKDTNLRSHLLSLR